MFTVLLAVILMLAAIGIDIWLRPPLYLYLVALALITVTTVLSALRVFKGVLLYAAYEQSQDEGNSET